MLNDIFLCGAGYSARAFTAARPDPGVRIAGTTRTVEGFTRLEEAGIEPFVFDGVSLGEEARRRIASAQGLVVSAAPEARGDPFLAAGTGAVTAARDLRWVGYLSTVGVYGDHDGAWIDEEAPLRPRPGRSAQRVEAERAWIEFCSAHGISLAILRLSGIYGPGRNAFVNLRDGTARRLVKPGQVFNRIHVDDIAGALWHLAAAGTGGVFNVTDDRPAPPQDVVAYAALRMGVTPPPEMPFETAELSPMARSFYGENKRVSNARLKATGYGFRYPDYETALDAMWADGSWQGEPADRRSPIRKS
jgi:nucleoside-diphosphate-sugar epimerase